MPQLYSKMYRCVQMCITFVPQVLLVDVQQDATVAATHHQQGDDVQRGEVKHVVKRLLPAAAEAAVSRTLSEVDGLHPDRLEDKELQDETQSLSVHPAAGEDESIQRSGFEDGSSLLTTMQRFPLFTFHQLLFNSTFSGFAQVLNVKSENE